MTIEIKTSNAIDNSDVVGFTSEIKDVLLYYVARFILKINCGVVNLKFIKEFYIIYTIVIKIQMLFILIFKLILLI